MTYLVIALSSLPYVGLSVWLACVVNPQDKRRAYARGRDDGYEAACETISTLRANAR